MQRHSKPTPKTNVEELWAYSSAGRHQPERRTHSPYEAVEGREADPAQQVAAERCRVELGGGGRWRARRPGRKPSAATPRASGDARGASRRMLRKITKMIKAIRAMRPVHRMATRPLAGPPASQYMVAAPSTPSRKSARYRMVRITLGTNWPAKYANESAGVGNDQSGCL